MSLLRTRAIVLRRIAYGDTSWIVHAYTEEAGRLALIAKGARRPRSPLAGCLEPLQLTELVAAVRPGRDLHPLSQACALDSRPHLGRSFDAMVRGLAMAELVQVFVRESLPHPELFMLFNQALHDLGSFAEPDLVLWRFLSGLSEELGLGLRIDSCPQCDSPCIPESPVVAPHAGGFLCEDCGSRTHNRTLDPILAGLVRQSCHGVFRSEQTLSIPRTGRAAIDQLWYEHLCHGTGLQPRFTARTLLDEARP